MSISGNTRAHDAANERWMSLATADGWFNDKEMLTYLLRDHSSSAIGDLFGCSAVQVRNRAHLHDIALRGPGGKNHHKHKGD